MTLPQRAETSARLRRRTGEVDPGETLLGGQTVPAHGFGIVLENAPAVGVHETEVELRIGVTLVGEAAGFRDRVRVLPERPRRD